MASRYRDSAARPGSWEQDEQDVGFLPFVPGLVGEGSDTQLSGDRFRHTTRVERWRPDEDAAACTFAPSERPDGPTFADLVTGGRFSEASL